MMQEQYPHSPQAQSEQQDHVFYRYAPFIQEYIYSHGWSSLREVQLAAGHVLFDSDDNLLISSATASGKTEAAFFPILTLMYEEMPKSIGVLYIAPLKSLINDQFGRMEELIEQSGVPVFHWHGDVAASHKNKVLQNPQGILQITPESLESMLMNRSNDIARLFGALRFVVIDEVHALTGTDRGNQIRCQLERIARLIGHQPRRIGLSATIGDVETAADWLGANTNRHTAAPLPTEQKTRWRLGMEHFYLQNDAFDQTRSADTAPGAKKPERAIIDAGYEYIYECVKGKKALVFSNSREETEYVTATLRQIARNRQEPDRFLIHHGNLSAAIREDAEEQMKDDARLVVTCATVTLELGVDIGQLERIVQADAPSTVSSLLQRLGRSGRRGGAPEMMMVFREENPTPETPMPQRIPWGLLRGIAMVQLYTEERFIEPPRVKKMPFSLLFQQTLSILSSSGEMTPKRLAERVLSMAPFRDTAKEDYKALMISMIQNDFLELTAEKTLIVGLKGEKLTNNFRFYAVFKDMDMEYSVRCSSEEIGTITTPPPVGDRFALAGRVWEVEELDLDRRLIYVHPVMGKMEVSWPGDFGEVHTRILERMRQVLVEDTDYPYLKANARERLQSARNMVRNSGVLSHSLVNLGGMTWCLFPWLGTRSFRTLRKFIAAHAHEYGISKIEYEGCYYMQFKMEDGTGEALIRGLNAILQQEGLDRERLVADGEIPVFEKYDPFIPEALLRRAYAYDRLRTDELILRLEQIRREYQKSDSDESEISQKSRNNF